MKPTQGKKKVTRGPIGPLGFGPHDGGPEPFKKPIDGPIGGGMKAGPRPI